MLVQLIYGGKHVLEEGYVIVILLFEGVMVDVGQMKEMGKSNGADLLEGRREFMGADVKVISCELYARIVW